MGPILQDGRAQDKQAPQQQWPISSGGLRITDFGSVTLGVLQRISESEGDWLCRSPRDQYPPGSSGHLVSLFLAATSSGSLQPAAYSLFRLIRVRYMEALLLPTVAFVFIVTILAANWIPLQSGGRQGLSRRNYHGQEPQHT